MDAIRLWILTLPDLNLVQNTYNRSFFFNFITEKHEVTPKFSKLNKCVLWFTVCQKTSATEMLTFYNYFNQARNSFWGFSFYCSVTEKTNLADCCKKKQKCKYQKCLTLVVFEQKVSINLKIIFTLSTLYEKQRAIIKMSNWHALKCHVLLQFHQKHAHSQLNAGSQRLR